MTIKKILCVSILSVAASSTMAAPLSDFGTDITVFDQNIGGGSSWNYGGHDGRVDQNGDLTREDNEVEPGMATGQAWDAEGVFARGNNITFVAGFDFVNGYTYRGKHYSSGDLFIDVNGDAQFGDYHNAGTAGNQSVQNRYGFDYVVDIDWSNGTYNVFGLGDDSFTITSSEAVNQGSNPWQYDEASSDDELIESGDFYVTKYSDEDLEEYFAGGDHYAARGINLSFLGDDQAYTTSWTMLCGNDNLIGQGATEVPEPTTFALLGLGLLGLGAMRRKQA